MAQDKNTGVVTRSVQLLKETRLPIPMRPITLNQHGRPCFQENKIVCFLLEHGGIDLNELRRRFRDPSPDWEEFYQLIGYSTGGYGELPVVSPESVRVADALANALIEARLWEGHDPG